MSKFYPLKVASIQQTTNDAVVISFAIPDELRTIFKFKPGQYVTIVQEIKGEEVRRAYSICSSPKEEGIAIGVKHIKDGKMSTYLNKKLKVNDILNIIPPYGNFCLTTNINNKKHYVALCAGSGITPILSMIKTVVMDEKNSTFMLVYGNKNRSSVMFQDEIDSLLSIYKKQFSVIYAFSQEKVENEIFGRIDKKNLQQVLFNHGQITAQEYFLCGPGKMIDELEEVLHLYNISKNIIHYERFTSALTEMKIDKTKSVLSNVIVIVDGEEYEFQLSSSQEAILDAAIDKGADVPFSCKGAVCCTCKAKILEGKARMSNNYSLSDEEVKDGYILTCQAHPITENVIIDYDVI